jgi:hypothetical protein
MVDNTPPYSKLFTVMGPNCKMARDIRIVDMCWNKSATLTDPD